MYFTHLHICCVSDPPLRDFHFLWQSFSFPFVAILIPVYFNMLLLKTWFIWCGPFEINRTDLTKNLQPDCCGRSRNGENVSVFVGRQKGLGELRCLTCLCGVGGMCNSPVAVGRKDMIHTTWIRYDSRKRSQSAAVCGAGLQLNLVPFGYLQKNQKKNSVWFSRDTRTSETLADLADRTRGSLIFVMKATATICNIHGEPENEMNINKDFDLTATSPLAISRSGTCLSTLKSVLCAALIWALFYDLQKKKKY